MALERPPKLGTTPDTSTYEALKKYLPIPDKVLRVHTASATETLGDVAKAAGMPFWDYVEFIFPGCNGDPQCVNWYLNYRLGCPNTSDGKNRKFKGGEKLCLPIRPTAGVPAPGPLEPVAPPNATTYLRARAVAYAERYVLTANPQFHVYSNDCTNFVSECMLAGGWPMLGGTQGDYDRDTVWWYGRVTPPESIYSDFISWLRNTGRGTGSEVHDFERYLSSKTWAGAEPFARFLQKSRRAQAVPSEDALQPGDVIQVRVPAYVHHTMFVIRRKGTDLQIANHSGRAPVRWLSEVRQTVASHESFIFWKVADRIA